MNLLFLRMLPHFLKFKFIIQKVKKQFKFKMNFFIHKSIKYLLILAINFTPMT